MYKYVYGLLQEFSRHRPSSSHKPSHNLSTKQQEEVAKISQSMRDKRLRSFVLSKLNTIQAEKKVLLSNKRKLLLWYKIMLDKMVSPLIEYMPDITTSYHISRLTDFRTYDGFSVKSEDVTTKKIVVRHKCVEEPIPILIKPEYRVLISHKKDGNIVNSFKQARASKNKLINKYKVWKSKIMKEPENQKKSGKTQRMKDLNLALIYDLFLKDAVEAKIENLILGIKAKHDHLNTYDFRFRKEAEVEQCESNQHAYDKVAASPNKKVSVNPNLSKTLNRNKTVIPSPSNTKNYNKAYPVTLKNKPFETLPLKKKEDKYQVLAARYSKEENQEKPPTQRTLHKQNWTRSENRIKIVKSDTTKDKSKLRTISLKSKMASEIQHANSDKFATGTQSINNSESIKQNTEEKVDSKNYSNNNGVKSENIPEFLLDAVVKSNENILNETKTSYINVTEISEKNLDTENGENNVKDPITACGADSNPETVMVTSLEKSDSVCNFESITTHDEPNRMVYDSTMPYDNGKFTHDKDADRSKRQNEDQNELAKNKPGNGNKILSDCELLEDPKDVNSLLLKSNIEEDKKETPKANLITKTYLVSFKDNEDGACLKTRSQIVTDKLTGNLVDFDDVLEEERKAREVKLNETSENVKHNNVKQNLLLNTNARESHQFKECIQKSDFRNKEYRNAISPVNNQDVLTKISMNNLSKNENQINSSKSNPNFYASNVASSLDKNNVSEVKLSKRTNSMKIRFPEHNKENTTEDKTYQKSVGKTLPEQIQSLNKSHSLEVIKREQNKNALKHSKVLREKGKTVFINMADKKTENLSKTKEHNKNKNYQEIINSVKHMIDNKKSNDTLVEGNKNKIVLMGAKRKNNADESVKYTKTISELKNIINDLSGGENEYGIGAAKSKYSTEADSKGNKNIFRADKEQKITQKEKMFDSKSIKQNANKKIKLINLKTINIIDKNHKVNKDLKAFSAEKISTETNNIKPGSQIEQKEYGKTSNMTTKTEITNSLKHQRLSTAQSETPNSIQLKEGRNLERSRKAKSVVDISYRLNEKKTWKSKEIKKHISLAKNLKSDKVKRNSSNIELPKTSPKIRNKSAENYVSTPSQDQSTAKINQTANVDLASTGTHDIKNLKVVNISPERSKSVELKSGLAITGTSTSHKIRSEPAKKPTDKRSKSQTDPTFKGNKAFVLTKMSGHKTTPINNERIVKSANEATDKQRKILKHIRKSETVYNKVTKSDNNLKKDQKNISMKEKLDEGKTITGNDQSPKPIQDTIFRDNKHNTVPKAIKKETQLTGVVLRRKTLKIKKLSNKKHKTDFQSLKSSSDGYTSNKSSAQSKTQENDTGTYQNNEELLSVNKKTENSPIDKIQKKDMSRKLNQKVMQK